MDEDDADYMQGSDEEVRVHALFRYDPCQVYTGLRLFR